MSYWENFCQNRPSWDNNSQVETSYSCLGSFGNNGPDYRFDPNYLELCNVNESHLVYYSFSGAGDHTAIREALPNNGGFKYLSKYGPDGPVIGHDLNGTWYHLTNATENAPKEYWHYLGDKLISGNTNIIGTSAQTYSFPNIQGVNYSWTILSSGGGNAYVSSGQSTNQVTLIPTHSGTITLKLTLDTSCGSPKYKTLDINIQTNICLEGHYISNGSSPQPMFTANSVGIGTVTTSISCPNTSHFNWSKTGGSISNWSNNGSGVSFTMTSGGSISFKVTAYPSGQFRNITFYNFGSFLISPNPSSTEMSIDLNADLTFDIEINSLETEEKRVIKNYKGGAKIDLGKLKHGNYVVRIKYQDEVLAIKKVIIGDD